MKALKLYYIFLVISFFSVSCRDDTPDSVQTIPVDNEELTPIAPSPTPTPTPHPLSVDGMVERVFPDQDLTTVSVINDNRFYTSSDVTFTAEGVLQHALLSVPKTPMPPEGYPVIFLLHGHIPEAQYSTTGSYPLVFDRYAKSEFIVIKPDYRGHGRSEINPDFSRHLSTIYFAEDVLYLLTAMKSRDDVNPEKLFLMGHSMGGEISLKVMIADPSFKAASLWAPVTVSLGERNFFYRNGGRSAYGAGALESGDPRLEESINAVNSDAIRLGIGGLEAVAFEKAYNRIRTPVRVHHGDADVSVPFLWSEDFVKEFQDSNNGQEITLTRYPGEDHNISQSQALLQQNDLNWFRSFMTS